MWRKGIVALLWIASTGLAHGAEVPASAPLYGDVQRDSRPALVGGNYYTQLHVAITAPQLPKERKAGQKLFAAMLKSLGGGKSSREINVSVRVSMGDVSLPEYSLVSYRLDTDSGQLVAMTNGGHSFPLKRLESTETIGAEVVFRDVKQSQYDLNKLTATVSSLVPGTALLSEATKPFFRSMSGLGQGIFSAMGGQSTDLTFREELSPYAGNVKQVVLPLRSRTGEEFGVVTLSMLATPTLSRAPRDIFSAGPADLRRLPEEDPARLMHEVAGVRNSYLGDLRALPAFSDLLRGKSTESIRKFCTDARESLAVEHGLTLMDSARLTLMAMNEAGYRDVVNGADWYYACFSPSEVHSLATSDGIEPPASEVPPVASIDSNTLFALGCWMISSLGPDCARRAPDPESTLASALASNVAIAIDSGFLDLSDVGDGESVSRERLIESLRGAAAKFSCFRRGMLLAADDRIFRLEGEVAEGRISRLVIRPVPANAWSCTI